MPNQKQTKHPLKLFALNSNRPLAEKIAAAAWCRTQPGKY